MERTSIVRTRYAYKKRIDLMVRRVQELINLLQYKINRATFENSPRFYILIDKYKCVQKSHHLVI